MPVVGVTGHQRLSPPTQRMVRSAIEERLARIRPLVGATSLAEGADQIFAHAILRLGGSLVAIIPATRYEATFATVRSRDEYRRLRLQASDVVELPFTDPTEDAYWAAGRNVVDRSDLILAVWDGQPAGGLGGTADVVEYAKRAGKPLVRIWPSGASRE